ncbi:MAG: haloacid dehalogenase-like hydrolase [Candidatus Neomarinimicrobiota bacterium]|nr:haloacid dehalogenase-like hydrolase [Candidatus Neomarinimicrobiota bacterium]MEC9448303.1 haloacid dehalogenase-like hydrolase [Candidatus Neomarinimicrobiota bacterium]
MIPDYIIIDFDSTFITEESLDELAKYKLRDQPDSQTMLNKIKSLTNAGMNGDIPFKQSLDERMEVLNLNRSDINSVSKILSECVTPSFTKNKSFFIENNNKIMILSGGFKELIVPIVDDFGISSSNVFANDFIYNSSEQITGINQDNIMSKNGGKVKQSKLLSIHGTVHVIGDGYTDYEIKLDGPATHFFAFTENVERKNICELADLTLSNFDDYINILK